MVWANIPPLSAPLVRYDLAGKRRRHQDGADESGTLRSCLYASHLCSHKCGHAESQRRTHGKSGCKHEFSATNQHFIFSSFQEVAYFSANKKIRTFSNEKYEFLVESQGFEEPNPGTYVLFSCYLIPFRLK